MAAELLIKPAIALGLIIGIYEAILLHRDVTIPTHRFGHSIHAIFYAIIAVFATMNVEFVMGYLTFLPEFLQNVLMFRILIGIITMVKIHGVSAAIKGSYGGGVVGTRETWFHSFLIAALVVLAPYVWPFLEPIAPAWLK
ncbi:MAG: hypothetical protein QXU88_01210 [Candidatus Woesearchaeota archaeon]